MFEGERFDAAVMCEQFHKKHYRAPLGDLKFLKIIGHFKNFATS